mmetsp:Transcript_35398/g.74723  ORF Transcript_35398/g.74723 Transcript_35398/m.74723 type:complete len:102 (-) Transcript_35398:1136-1441(-)
MVALASSKATGGNGLPKRFRRLRSESCHHTSSFCYESKHLFNGAAIKSESERYLTKLLISSERLLCCSSYLTPLSSKCHDSTANHCAIADALLMTVFPPSH